MRTLFSELVSDLPDDAFSFREHRVPEKQEQREQGQDHAAPHGPGAYDEAVGHQGGVREGDVLHFDRQDKEQQDLIVGIQQGESQEEGHVQVGVGVVSEQEAPQDTAQDAEEVVQVEAPASPALLQGGPQEVIEVQREYDENDTAGGRQENEREQPPDLASQDHGPIKAQESHDGRAAALSRKERIDSASG